MKTPLEEKQAIYRGNRKMPDRPPKIMDYTDGYPFDTSHEAEEARRAIRAFHEAVEKALYLPQIVAWFAKVLK